MRLFYRQNKTMIKVKKYGLCVLLVISIVASLGGCQSKRQEEKKSGNDSLTQITMVLEQSPNTNHTGIYVAQQLGYFEDVGLEVEIILPPDEGTTDVVASGTAEFGIDTQEDLAEAFSADDPVEATAVAAILQHNLQGIISTKDKGIDSFKKMEDHSFATNDTLMEQTILRIAMEKEGGDFGRVHLLSSFVDNAVDALHTDIDCAWIYYGWDGIRCQLASMVTNFVPFASANEAFDYYSPVIIGNNNFLSKQPDISRDFLSAIKKGYQYAIDYPKKAAEILCENAPDLDMQLVEKSQQYLKDKYIADAAQFGVIDGERWNGFYNWLWKNKIISKEIPENTGFTNEYIMD